MTTRFQGMLSGRQPWLFLDCEPKQVNKMKSLWFKQVYVAEILAGRKTDTIRKPDCKPFEVGDIIALQVGPRSPFAHAVVTGFVDVTPDELGERLQSVQAIYGIHSGYKRLTFKVVRVFHECPEVIKAMTVT